MLYIVGGCSRSGKSLLAERMRSRHGIPWFSLDALKMGLHLGCPQTGILPSANDIATADQMWPIIEPILDHALFDGRPYLVEGVNLRPETIAAFIDDADAPVTACFLGYPDIPLREKIAAVHAFRGPPTDWLVRTGPQHMRSYLDTSRALSRVLRDACNTNGMPFVDTGRAFEAGIAAAEHILMGWPGARVG